MNELKSNKFCDLLKKMIKDCDMTQSEFYEKLGITKSYFYDILAGKSTPPPDKQIAIMKILKPSHEYCSLFFELAAKERNEVPADIVCFLDEKKKAQLRRSTEYKKMLKDLIKGENSDDK